MTIDNRSARLWILCLTLTGSVILFTQVGIGLGLEYSLISGLAIAAWWRQSAKLIATPPSVVVYYVLSIVCLLVLSTFRYAAHFGQFIHAQYPTLFQPDFTNTYTHWFLLQVCMPVSFLLLGGYCLIKQPSVGLFFAWWGFLFCLAEALIQFSVELTHPTQYGPVYYLGILTAIVQFLISGWGLLAVVKPLTRRQVNLWSGLFISFGAVYAITLYTQAGPLPVGVILGSMMGGLIGWRKTTALRSVDPYKVVPLYLLLQALFYLHVGEEVATHFNQGIAALSGHPWRDAEFDYLITLIGPIVWVYAAYSLWKGQAFGNFILWFMIVGMIVGEPTHLLVFPVVRMVKEGVEYDYFPGMYTALFPMIPAILALVLILNDHKTHQQHRANLPF